MSAKNVEVKLASASYEIKIDSGNLKKLGSELVRFSPTKVFVLYDENVKPHLKVVCQSLNEQSVEFETYEVPAGEASKSIAQAAQIWEFLADQRADRRSIIVALGGGVVGDLAGFIAASFARGIPFFQVPTTLLSHVDSSVGGKTGINLSAAKNMVGAFWQPVGVLIDIDTLSTLEDREYLSGLAEVIKYGLIMDAPFFEKLEKHAKGLVSRDRDLLIDVIAHCCSLKAQVVQEDEKETTGRRAILNYGHTFAHAFETVFGYGKYLHGEAVAVGMLCAGSLALQLGRVTEDFCRRQLALLESVGLPTSVANSSVSDLIAVMQRDKKNVDDIIRFIMPDRIGNVELIATPIDRKLIEDSLINFMQPS